ncbi:hypothetical protein BDR06DRAFT_1051950, partial [Suillus hirtellus]
MSTDYSFSSPFQHDNPYFQQHQTPHIQNSLISSGSSKVPNYSDHDHHSTGHHSWNDPSSSLSALESSYTILRIAAFNTLATSISLDILAILSFTGLTINRDVKFKPSCTIPGMKLWLQPLNRKDYPKTQFWTEDMYTKWLKTPASQWVHENCAAFPFPFLEDMDGKLIVKAKVSNILKTFHAGTDVLDDVADEMARHHPVLALCSNGWKVQAIATEYYPLWTSTHIKKRKKSSDAIAVVLFQSFIEPPTDLSSLTPSNEPDHPVKQPKVDEALMVPLATPNPIVSMTMATTLPTSPIASGHSLSKSGSEHVPDSMTLLATPDSTVSMTMGTTLPISLIASGHPLSESGSKHVPDLMTPATLLATPDPIVSTTMATTLPTGPTDSSHPPSESGSKHVPDSMTPLAAPDLTVSHLPQIKNLLAKLVLSKKPNPSASPVLAPSMNLDTDTTMPTKLLMPPIAKDAILPTPGSIAGTMDNTSDMMTTKKFWPTATKNGKNLCTHHWLKIIALNGTSGDYKLYWNVLSKDSQLVKDGTCTRNAAKIWLGPSLTGSSAHHVWADLKIPYSAIG